MPETGLRPKLRRKEPSLEDKDRMTQLTVWVERIDDQTYRAEIAQPISLTTQGRTCEEAVERLCELAKQRLSTGDVIQLDLAVETATHPWVPFAGIWKGHPEADAWQNTLAEQRRQLDKTESGA